MFDHLCRPTGSAAQQGMQAGGELTQVEGFDEVVVSARLKPGDPLGYRIPGGQDQHRQLEAAAAQALQKAQAVFVRQTQIENHQVEAGCAQQRVGLPGRSGMGHAEALGFEPGDDATGDQCVVFCQQYVHVGIA